MKKILAIETSCDDTSVAVIDTDYNVHANLISSQPEHDLFGGVVPELASRVHLKNIVHLTEAALKKAQITFDDIDAIAVSVNPGLIGALLVGVSYAKSLAYGLGLPLIAVNHMVGHVAVNMIEHKDEMVAPYLVLVVSGGHTELAHFTAEREFEIVGRTIDDAAGEAFDKSAKLLGLGYPGGPIIDKLAKQGDSSYQSFTIGMKKKDNYNFSFSGLKTAIRNFIESHSRDELEEHKYDIAASVQTGIVDNLLYKTLNYLDKNRIKKLVLAGGVSANSELRSRLETETAKRNVKLIYPSLKYCTDNAAMIGAAAVEKLHRKEFSDLDLNAFSTKGFRIL